MFQYVSIDDIDARKIVRLKCHRGDMRGSLEVKYLLKTFAG